MNESSTRDKKFLILFSGDATNFQRKNSKENMLVTESEWNYDY